MVVFLHGKDSFMVARRRSFIRDAFRKKYPGAAIAVIAADKGDGAGIADDIAAAGAEDLFGSKRLVDARGACLLSETAQKAVIAMLKESGKRLDILFSEADTPTFSKNPLAAYLKKHADRVDAFDRLSPREAERFLLAELSGYSGTLSISRAAVSELVGFAEGDSGTLSTTAATLAAFRDEGEITADDVRLFVSSDPEERAFLALDELLSGNRSRAVSILLREARSDGTALRIMGLLAWQVRELFRVRESYDRGIRRADDIARAIGMKPFVAGKLLARIDRFPLPRLRDAISLLADLDARVKSGRVENEFALMLFVGRM